MIISNLSRRQALLWIAGAASAPLAMSADLPGDSVYQFRSPLVDQDGNAFELASARGRPVLISMFYSSCEMVCPMIFETIQKTVKSLPAAERERMKIVMISFDPARDTVAVLKHTAEAHGCGAQWTLARTDESNARKIAALLGVQYRRLASGEFNHSSTIELLDVDGRITARSGTLGAVDPALMQSMRKALVARA